MANCLEIERPLGDVYEQVNGVPLLEVIELHELEVHEEWRMARCHQLAKQCRCRARNDVGHVFMTLPRRSHHRKGFEFLGSEGGELLDFVDCNHQMSSGRDGELFREVQPALNGVWVRLGGWKQIELT